MSYSVPRAVEPALILRADWHWRRGPKWKAALAWLFGQRQFVRTRKGHLAYLTWWRGDPYLLSIEEVYP